MDTEIQPEELLTTDDLAYWTKWRRNTAPTDNATGKAYRTIQDESNYTVWEYNTKWDYFVKWQRVI